MSDILRHRAAIRRNRLSRPLRLARETGLLAGLESAFDYGCGYGDDVRRLRRLGLRCSGWDTYHQPNTPLVEAYLVNLGFVLNVIEKPQERLDVLKRAWNLANKLLLVGALVTTDAKGGAVPYGDGVVTSIGTFQKYFDQQELENLLTSTLRVPPVALGMGIFAVVRDPKQRTELLARQFQTGRSLGTEAVQQLFEGNQRALEPLLQFFHVHGRWPTRDEPVLPSEAVRRFGSVGRAVALMQRILDPQHRHDIVSQVRSDLLVLLSVLHLSGGARLRDLSPSRQRDIRTHFGSYTAGNKQAQALLYSLGKAEVLRETSRHSSVGKRMPDALYVHTSAVRELPTELRVYEACARRFLGGTEQANLIKMRLGQPVVSFLSYPHFERDPHPSLARSLRVDLQTFRVRARDYTKRLSPPILHRKELFVSTTHPLHAKFARLTAHEERWHLFDGSTGDIGTRAGWERRLEAAGVSLKGHRVLFT